MKPIREECVLVQIKGKVLGPIPVCQLGDLEGFDSRTLVSYPGSGKWGPANDALTIRLYDSRTMAPVSPKAVHIIHGPVASDMKQASGVANFRLIRFSMLAIASLMMIFVAWYFWPVMKILASRVHIQPLTKTLTVLGSTAFSAILAVRRLSRFLF